MSFWRFVSAGSYNRCVHLQALSLPSRLSSVPRPLSTGAVLVEEQRLSPVAYDSLADVLEHASNLREIEVVDMELLLTGSPRIAAALVDMCPRLSNLKMALRDNAICMDTLQRMRHLKEVNLYLDTSSLLSTAIVHAFQSTPTILKLSSVFSLQLSGDLHMPYVDHLELLGPTLRVDHIARAFPNLRRLTLHQGFPRNLREELVYTDIRPCWQNLDFLQGDADSLYRTKVVCPVSCLKVVLHPYHVLRGSIKTIPEDKRLLSIFDAASPISLSFATQTKPTRQFLSSLVPSTPRLRFLHMVLEPKEWKSPVGRASTDILETLTWMPDALSGLPAIYLSVHIGVVVALFQMHDKRFRDALALRFAQALPSVRFFELGLKAADNEEYPHRWWYKFEDMPEKLRQGEQLRDGRAWRDYWSKQVLRT